jgi:hypothetical protein
MANIKPSMFHVKPHRVFFYLYLLFIPIQTRIGYFVEQAYVSWYFNYHLTIFLYLSDILLFLCFTCWLLFDPPKWAEINNKRLLWLILGFLAIISVSLLHVKQLHLGVFQVIKWLEALAILVYIVGVFKKRLDFRISLAVIGVAAVFQSLLGIAQFHMQHMIGLRWLGEYIAPMGTSGLATIDTASGKLIRAYGTMPHPNVLAAFLIMGLAAVLYFVSRESNKLFAKIALAFSLLPITIGAFLTFSRVAWLAAIIIVCSHVVYNIWKKQKTPALIIISLIIVSCATIGLLYHNELRARVSDPDTRSISDRYYFNHLGLELIKSQPLLGVGVGNYVPALQQRYQLEPWQYQPAHNIFIFIGAELGLIGLILFLAILFIIVYRLKNISLDPLSITLIGLGFVFLFMGQLDHYFVTIQQGRLMFVTILGLLAALPNIYIYDHQKNS